MLISREPWSVPDPDPLIESLQLALLEIGAPDGPEVASALVILAELYRKQGRHAECDSLHRRATALAEMILGLPDSLEVAATLTLLAGYHHGRGQYAMAERLYWRALAIGERGLGAEHPTVLAILDSIVDLCVRTQRRELAEPYRQRSILARRKAIGSASPGFTLEAKTKALGPDHPAVATAAFQVAESFVMRDGHHAAISFYESALRIRQKALGRDHPDVATTLEALAACYRTLGRHFQATDMLGRATEIRLGHLRARTPRRSDAPARPQEPARTPGGSS